VLSLLGLAKLPAAGCAKGGAGAEAGPQPQAEPVSGWLNFGLACSCQPAVSRSWPNTTSPYHPTVYLIYLSIIYLFKCKTTFSQPSQQLRCTLASSRLQLTAVSCDQLSAAADQNV
jgi:hypothetical protein